MPATHSPIDGLLPADMAARAEDLGVRKAEMPIVPMFALAVLAGAFIALGAIFATTVTAGAGSLPYGLVRLMSGLAFSLGLVLVVVGGAELFTGNNLIVMAWASRKVRTRAVVRNWVVVYIGNAVGAVGTAVLVFIAGQYAFGGGSVGAAALGTALAKSNLEPVPAIALGVLCNALVCLAVWLSYSARTTGDRIVAVVLPITAFVAAGFEHSIANMYFLAIGLLVHWLAPAAFWTTSGLDPAAYDGLTVASTLGNLVPVTIGNILGGSLLVGIVYWFIYLRKGGDH